MDPNHPSLMSEHIEEEELMEMPRQSTPIDRRATTVAVGRGQADGLTPCATGCEGLTGLAQQMCYALIYGK